MLSCQPHSLPAMTKYIMTCGQQRATRMPDLVRAPAYVHARLCLRRQHALHYLRRAQVYPHAQGALHVTQHREIFKHRIQRKKAPSNCSG